MKAHFYLPIIPLLLSAFSCNDISDEMPVEEQSQPSVIKKTIGISPDKQELDQTDAMTVARIFKSGNRNESRAVNTNKVTTITGDDGHPALYAVDLDDGYVIVSATKKSIPIQAFVEHGRFGNVVSETGRDIIVRQMIEEKEQARKLPQNPDVKKAWVQFEDRGMEAFIRNNKSRAVSPELEAAQELLMEDLDAKGYSFGILSRMEQEIPTEIFERFWETARDEYDTDEPSLEEFKDGAIVAYRKNPSKFTPPVITTKWGQGWPYNSFIEGQTTLFDKMVGCVAIAVGQIMKYYKHPNTFQWNLMPDVLKDDFTSTTLPDFLSYLHKELNISDNGGVTVDEAKRFLSSLGYIIQDGISYPKKFPIFTRGYSTSRQEGHAWLICGEDEVTYQDEYILFLPERIGMPTLYKYIEVDQIKQYYGQATYHYMNWGDGGYYDGWYVDYSLVDIAGTSSPNDFTKDRKFISILGIK